MKYIKLLAMLMLPLGFCACSDDDDFNSGQATVGFEESEITIKENTGALNIPVVVEGDHNGLVQVRVAVKDAQGENVEVDKNIIMTGDYLNMNADTPSANIELRLSLFTSEDTKGRSFTLELTSANGATLSQATCKVNIEEVSDPYGFLAGTWTLVDLDQKAGPKMNLAPNADKSGYTATFNIAGNDCAMKVNYSAEKGLEFVADGKPLFSADFGGDLGVCDVVIMAGKIGADGGLSVGQQNIHAHWNDTFNQIIMDEIIVGVLFKNGEFLGRLAFGFIGAVK